MRSTFFLCGLYLCAATVAGAGWLENRDVSAIDLLPTAPPSAAPTSTEPPSTSSTDSAPPSETTSSTTTSESSSSTTSSPPSTSSSSESSTTSTSHTTTEPTTSSEPAKPSVTSESSSSSSETTAASATTVVTTRIISGTPVRQTFVTPVPSSTSAPSLNSSGGDSGSSGLSSSAKKTIIGVVVGVGGAIVVAGIAFVAWRIWGRNRNGGDHDEDDLMSAGTAVGSNSREKAPSPGSASTPFRSTLDQYHNPGPVNAASNF